MSRARNARLLLITLLTNEPSRLPLIHPVEQERRFIGVNIVVTAEPQNTPSHNLPEVVARRAAVHLEAVVLLAVVGAAEDLAAVGRAAVGE